MKLASFRGVDIVCSPLLMLALPAAYLTGRTAQFAAAFASLSVHEAAHAAAARRAGCKVSSIELMPFGFVAKLDCAYASAHDTAAVFAAGPIASLILSASAALIARFATCGGETLCTALNSFSDINLLLAAINLLPALPLDGGRLLQALVMSRGASAGFASRMLAAVGVISGVALMLVFGLLAVSGVFNPSLLLMGGFLAFSAARELRPKGMNPIKHRRLGPTDSIAVKQLAVGQMTCIAHTLAILPVGAYSVVSVLDGQRLIGTLTEGELIAAAQKLGASATMRSAVAYCNKMMV